MKKNLFLLLLIGITISGYAQTVSTGTCIDGHYFVDLGLPSGTLWATCNIGASYPEEYGDYFMWGETTAEREKPTNMKTDYKWCEVVKLRNFDVIGASKYVHIDEKSKYYDDKQILDSDDDAANVKWGEKCRMPSRTQFYELLKTQNTTVQFTSINGVNGILIISKKNGNSIFLPSAGFIEKKSLKDLGQAGYYWSKDADSGAYDWNATCLKFGQNVRYNNDKNAEHTYYGASKERPCYLCIRPVLLTKWEQLRDQHERRKTQPVSSDIPVLVFNGSTSVTSPSYNINVSVKSKSAITGTKVLVNGELCRGVNAVHNDGADFRINQQTTLQAGNNTIHVEVTNSAGTATMENTIVYAKATPIPSPAPYYNNVTTQKRLVLVIGNSNYTSANRLVNPQNDAHDIATKLRSLGFDVIEKYDLTRRTMKDAIREFGTKSSSYDASLLYYAGHAIERNGFNYLIPVDASLQTAADVEEECIRADYVLNQLKEANSKMNIIILDACRNNPISRSWSRGISGGLANMDAPSGTFIAFSTAPGETADDGNGRNSPFAEAFLNTLDKPNLSLEMFFKKVLQSVRQKTNEKQNPWSNSSFYGDFYFNMK